MIQNNNILDQLQVEIALLIGITNHLDTLKVRD